MFTPCWVLLDAHPPHPPPTPCDVWPNADLPSAGSQGSAGLLYLSAALLQGDASDTEREGRTSAGSFMNKVGDRRAAL